MKEDLKRIFSQSNVVGKYVLTMVLLFLLLRILQFFGLDLVNWLSLPSRPSSLLFKPWTPITYMFTHIDTRHIFWNMILLWSGASIFTSILSEKQFIKTFWLGGLLGGLFFFVGYNLSPELRSFDWPLIGASGAVLAVLVAVTAYRPDLMVQLPLLGRFKLIYITVIFLVLTLPLSRSNMGGDLAHLGGILWGLYYGWQLRNTNDQAQWFDSIADQVMSWINGKRYDFKQGKKKKAKMKVYTQEAHVPRDDKEYNAMKKEKQEQVDRILEKISKSGYESLTAAEKAILFKASSSGKDA